MDNVEKIVNDIVEAIYPEEFSVKKQFFLTQSLLALARTAHTAGYKLGFQEATKEINRLFKLSDVIDGEALTKAVIELNRKRH